MKSTIITHIAAGLLGLLFLIFGLNFFLKFIPIPPAPEGTPAAGFLGGMYVTGFLTFVKVLEILGGIAVAVPPLRRLGLLLLGPIIVNIVAFHIFFTKGAGLTDPAVLIISLLGLYLLWAERRSFATFIHN
jgi:uncharacterized membrane protein YphA (DoxX/SURF4 family)